MSRHDVKYFDLSSFLSKSWNRITRLKHNNHMFIMHCMSHNRSHSSTLYWESNIIHSYYLDTKEEFCKEGALRLWLMLAKFSIYLIHWKKIKSFILLNKNFPLLTTWVKKNPQSLCYFLRLGASLDLKCRESKYLFYLVMKFNICLEVHRQTEIDIQTVWS